MHDNGRLSRPNKSCSEVKEKKVATPKPNFLLYLSPPSFSGIRRSGARETGRGPRILLSALSTQTHLRVYAQQPTETFQAATGRTLRRKKTAGLSGLEYS